MARTVGIFVFEGVEVLDFAGPYEVFTTASRMQARRGPQEPVLFDVFTIGRTKLPLRARAGLSVFPDFDFASHPALDVLIVPGGIVTAELVRPEVIAWIAGCSGLCEIVASVCTGAFLLAQAGLLAGLSATTHWEDVDEFKSMFPAIETITDVRWVDQGRIVSSAGISAGIDMSLHLVERLAGRELAQRTARQMDFDWTEND